MNFFKKQYILITLACMLFVVSSCDLQEVNVNPNRATDASMDLLLPSAEANLIWATNDFAAQSTSTLLQYMTGTVNVQYNITTYEYLPAHFETTWSTHFYAGAMRDLKTIIDKGTANGSPHYAGIAKIQMAIALGYLVDLWGDVPYSTALDLEQQPRPSFDKSEDLYAEIFSLLDEGISDLNNPTSLFTPSRDDLFYPQTSAKDWIALSIPEWIKTANALKARYQNHLSKIDPKGSAEKALAAITAGTFSSTAEELSIVFGNTGDAAGPWYGFLDATFGQNNISISQNFIDILEDRVGPGQDDPRLRFYVSKNKNGEYVGTVYGSSSNVENVSKVGPYVNAPEAPTNIITYAEIKFIEAEAQFRLENYAAAAAAYNEAVKASILRVTGGADAAYEAVFASEDETSIQTDGLQKIFMEKYIAMFLQAEAWTDWRRSIPAGSPGTTSGIPALVPSAQNGTQGVFPRRFLYPTSELSSAQGVPVLSLTDRVFWDK